MLKLQKKVVVVKMSQYLANQHSIQTAIKPSQLPTAKNREIRVD
jgi:hypothetical protein